MPNLIRYKRSREAEAWLRKEISEQKARHRQIEHEQHVVLAQKRDRWVDDFLERIQTRGYHVHFNVMRKIRPDEIPAKPRRKFKVVF